LVTLYFYNMYGGYGGYGNYGTYGGYGSTYSGGYGSMSSYGGYGERNYNQPQARLKREECTYLDRWENTKKEGKN